MWFFALLAFFLIVDLVIIAIASLIVAFYIFLAIIAATICFYVVFFPVKLLWLLATGRLMYKWQERLLPEFDFGSYAPKTVKPIIIFFSFLVLYFL